MKKLALILIAIAIVFSTSHADSVDLSSMSYNELIALQKKLTFEIMGRTEWKEVKVPAGLWIVGTDIPAGSYSMKAEFAGVTIWRKAKDNYADNGLYYAEVLKEDSPCGKIILVKGMVIELSGEVTFAPPMSLGF